MADVDFTARFPEELVKDLDKIAEAEKRSRNNLMEVVLTDYVKNRKAKKEGK